MNRKSEMNSVANRVTNKTKYTMPKQQHKTTNGAPMSDFEMFVLLSPGSKFKDFTFRGDKTLEFYRSKGIKKVTSELQALMLKVQNSKRFREVTIYDNTGSIPRRVIFEMKNGVIETDLLNHGHENKAGQ